MRIIKLEKLLNKNFCLLTKNGSTAVYLLIKSLKIEKKTIIIPANICFDIVLVILFTGNIPKAIDVDKDQCLSFNSLKKFKPKKKIGAIIYPYMYGNYGDVFKIKQYAKKRDIFFIEDVAPSLGIKVPSKIISDYSICSFGTGKILDMNIGGSLNINSEDIYIKAKKHYSQLKYYSNNLKKKYSILNKIYDGILEKKINKIEFRKANLYRFKDCIISKYYFKKEFLRKLNINISSLKKINNNRNEKAHMFQKILKNENIHLIKHKEGAVYWRQNVIVFKYRDKLLKYLINNKVYARKYFPSLDSVFPFISGKNLSLVKKFELGILNLWVGSQTSKNDIIQINKHINNFFY